MVRKNTLKFLIVFMFGIMLIPNFSYGATLLEDDFTGTIIDQIKWTMVGGSEGVDYIQNGNVNVRNGGVGSSGYPSFTRVLRSNSDFSKEDDLTISANITVTTGHAWLGYGTLGGNYYAYRGGSSGSPNAMVSLNGGSYSLQNCGSAPGGNKITLRILADTFSVYRNDILQCTVSVDGSAPVMTSHPVFMIGSTTGAFFDNISVVNSAVIPLFEPDAIGNLSASQWGNTTTNLTWGAPGDGGDPITDYTVDYRVSGDIPWTNFVDGVSATTGVTVTGLTNGVTYEFRVRAINGVGTATDSNIASVTVLAPTAPSTPSAPTASNIYHIDGGRASVAFSAPSENGSAITSYTITSSPGGFVQNVASSPATFTGLTNNVAYTFTVSATNAVGTSGNSPASNAVTPILSYTDLLWAKQLGGTSGDYANAVTLDTVNNIYMTGAFGGTADFDPGPGVQNLTSSGGTDIFISKLDSDGDFIWAKRVGGAGADSGESVAVDTLGNVYITGSFSGTVDFNPGAGVYNLVSGGGTDIFILKLDSNGDFLWAISFGGTGTDLGKSLALDSFANVHVAGDFMDIVDFDPGPGLLQFVSISPQPFILKFTTDGDFTWAKTINNTEVSRVESIAVDSLGNVYTTGNFSGTSDFDPGAGAFNVTSFGLNDIFVSKLDLNGDFVWAKRMGGLQNEGGESVFVDASGNLYTTGYFSGSGDYNPGAGTYNLFPDNVTDAFISKLDSNGDFVWAKKMGTRGESIYVDLLGNVYTLGIFAATADFDPGPTTQNLTSSGDYDVFVSKLDSSGDFVWAKRMGGSGSDSVSGIVLDSSGNIHIAGSFSGTADFDPGLIEFNLDSAGSFDIFLAVLYQDVVAPLLSEVTVVSSATNDNTPSYAFSSDEAGSITYGGSCASNTNNAVIGNNVIIFNQLADGVYSNCTIIVTDVWDNASIVLEVSEFTIDTISPTIAEITPVTTPTNDNTPSYTFSSDETGDITYGGSCTSATGATTIGNNTITFTVLADGEYSDCTITVTDEAGNLSNLLEVTTFVIDATAPVIAEVTPVSTPSTNTTPSYTFSSDEIGDITYGGSCTSATNTVTAGNNTITFDVLAVGDYADCTIVVTDDLNNNSNQLNITPFTITSPVVVQNEVAPAGAVSVVFLQQLSDRLRTGSAINDIGCAPGNLYSVTTGNRCTSNNNTVGPVTSTCPILPSVPRLLRLNMNDPVVKILQQILNCKGYVVSVSGAGSVGRETDFFGGKTREAVLKLQRENGLIVDGIVGNGVRNFLNN